MIFYLEKYGWSFCLLLMVLLLPPGGARAEDAKRIYTLETSIAQTLLTQARVNYYSALYSHNLAKARLRRGLGEY